MSDIDNSQNQSNIESSETIFTKHRLEVRRKNSDSSDTSSLLDTCSSQTDSISADDNSINIAKFNDIIEKIVELKFSPYNANDNDNKKVDIDKHNIGGDVNANYEDQLNDNKVKLKKEVDKEKGKGEKIGEEEEDSDDELRARGPLRPQPSQSRRKPYQPLDDWLEASAEMQNCTTDIDIQQILNNREYSDRINPCLDRLEHNWCTINSQDSGNGANWDDVSCI